MTQKELNQLYYLNKEIDMYKDKLKELEECEYKSPVVSLTPCGTGISDLTSSIATDRMHYQQLLKDSIDKRSIERNKVMEYIKNIDDVKIRQIFHLRHIEGMTWDEVGGALNYSRQGVYKQYKTYLQKSSISLHLNVI